MLKHLLVGLLGGIAGAAIGVFSLMQAADSYAHTVGAKDQERERFIGIVSGYLAPEAVKGFLAGSVIGCALASAIADRKPKREQIVNEWLDQMIASETLTPDERDAAIELKSKILTTRP
jgi:TctA family transporter